MIPSEPQTEWRQHYPTYHFSDRDIALDEYRFATKILETEERLFLNAANLSALVGAVVGFFAVGNLKKLYDVISPSLPRLIIPIGILALAFGFGYLSLRYLADRQKAVAFAARKVIVLRRMLGIDYGSLQLVLPNWRIEGANEPFAIRLFPGWNTYVAYPCFVVAGIVATLSFLLSAEVLSELDMLSGYERTLYISGSTSIFVFIALLWTYRKALLDTHERKGVLVSRQLSKWLRLKLVGNFEYVVYRASLATHELSRLDVDLRTLKSLLIYIEDKEFLSHSGISLRGLGRLIMSAFGRRPRSGGSTITQQLVRTLFITEHWKVVRRKLIELALARWFDKVAAKDRQLELYLASVRFESGVYGVAAAMKHFFGEVLNSPSAAESFFLIERVSNVHSKLLAKKINQTLGSAVEAGLLDRDSAEETVRLYENAVKEGKIVDPTGKGLSFLREHWATPESEARTSHGESPDPGRDDQAPA